MRGNLLANAPRGAYVSPVSYLGRIRTVGSFRYASTCASIWRADRLRRTRIGLARGRVSAPSPPSLCLRASVTHRVRGRTRKGASSGDSPAIANPAKRWRFEGAPRMATRILSAEFQGRNAGVASDCPLRRVCERADGLVRGAHSFSQCSARAHGLKRTPVFCFPIIPQRRRAAPRPRTPAAGDRGRAVAPHESYTCPTR